TTRAPASTSRRMVGSAARIRPSSVMRVPSNGTFRSERSNTQRPATPSVSRSSRFFVVIRSGDLAADKLHEVDEAAGEAPLVVVPADDLDLVADDFGQRRVVDTRGRVGHDVGGEIGRAHV